jgi:predicted aconitase with swiveling domain
LSTENPSGLADTKGFALNLILLGSPHFSLAEFRQLAPLLDGERRHPDVRFLVTTSRAVVMLAEQAGLLEPLRRFGGQLTVDTCPLATPMLPPEIRALMTNSAKYAYYAPGLLNTRVIYGSLADCVRSAIEGRVVRDETLWGDLTPQPPLLQGAGEVVAPLPSQGSRSRQGGRPELRGRAVVSGAASGPLLFSDAPLSFWGGYDPATGEIIDRRHPLSGRIAAGRVLAIPFTKGSSTTTAVLLEAVRAGAAPAAILTVGTDAFLALASVVAEEMYGQPVSVVALTPEDFAALTSVRQVVIQTDGSILLQ